MDNINNYMKKNVFLRSKFIQISNKELKKN